MRLGCIGVGAIAFAVLTALVGQNRHEIRISARSTARSAALKAEFPAIEVVPNAEVVTHSDVVFIGTTGPAAPAALTGLPFRTGQKVVSFMADCDTDTLRALVSPATLNAIMIPFPAIAQGGSPILCCPGSDLIDTLFGATDTVIPVATEAALGDFLAAQAVLSPTAVLVAETSAWLADRTGDPDSAQAFLRLLVGGSLLADPLTRTDALDALLAALDTPGGYNQRLRDHMRDRGMINALKDGLDALAKP